MTWRNLKPSRCPAATATAAGAAAGGGGESDESAAWGGVHGPFGRRGDRAWVAVARQEANRGRVRGARKGQAGERAWHRRRRRPSSDHLRRGGSSARAGAADR